MQVYQVFSIGAIVDRAVRTQYTLSLQAEELRKVTDMGDQIFHRSTTRF